MRHTLLLLITISLTSMTAGYEGKRTDSVLLNGQWDYCFAEGDEDAQIASNQSSLTWKQVGLPGPFDEWSERNATSIKFVWLKRTFDVTPSQAKKMAVLRWNRINFGATAFVNGTKVGCNEPTGPYQIILPKGLLKEGQNHIVLKIPGAAGMRKAKSGYWMIPSGFATNAKRGMPAVTDDIWLDFADDVYAKWALAIPDMAESKVRIRVTPAGLDFIENLTISARVKPWPKGETIGQAKTSARLVPNPDRLAGEHFFVEVPMPDFEPWTYENCNLYTAEIEISKDAKILDSLEFRFGMREITVADENYKLNGRNLWLRGSNLVFEWEWGNIVTGKEKDYLVTEAREMSLNSFRTHTQPPPRRWADVCDEYGTMILAEFPALFNGAHYGFDDEEWKIWHRNVITDAAGWMARLWNHPAVIMWVLTNESPEDGQWEAGEYHDFVLALDPTRPTMRAGAGGTIGTPENLDLHTCHNTIEPTEGRLMTMIPGWPNRAKGRPLTNSEYMNIFDRPRCQWTGIDDRDADALAYAQIGAEHTEAMRRARLDGLWPYMYAGWTKTRTGRVWKAGFAHPASAAWHSTLSAVLASLDLFDPDYLTGQQVTTDLYLINDSWHDAKIHVDMLITKECPELIPEAACFDNPVAKWSYDFELKADSIDKTPIKWKLPEAEGNYWLTARTTGAKDRPVLSQRFVRAIAKPEVSPKAAARTFIILGNNADAQKYFTAKGLKTSDSMDDLDPAKHMVIIWDAHRLKPEDKEKPAVLCEFAAKGGRIAILATKSWSFKDLVDISCASQSNFSRAFPYPHVDHPVLDGIDNQWMMRWNGLPGIVALTHLEGPALESATKIAWARDPKQTVVAELPAANGTGKILFSQLDIQSRLTGLQPDYDPVAERIFLNILDW